MVDIQARGVFRSFLRFSCSIAWCLCTAVEASFALHALSAVWDVSYRLLFRWVFVEVFSLPSFHAFVFPTHPYPTLIYSFPVEFSARTAEAFPSRTCLFPCRVERKPMIEKKGNEKAGAVREEGLFWRNTNPTSWKLFATLRWGRYQLKSRTASFFVLFSGCHAVVLLFIWILFCGIPLIDELLV
eukprot:RCo017961